MLKKKKPLDKFADLSWNDIEDWAGSKIVSRGRSYQRQGRVSELAFTDDGALIAWVDGSEQYATRVAMDADGLPESICTCPYRHDCKHGVAVVLEYLEQIENNRRIPKVKKGDERLAMLEDEDWDYEADDDEPILAVAVKTQIDTFLENKTKAQLIKLIHGLAEKYPEMAKDLADRQQLLSGDIISLVARLRREIRDIGDEPDSQHHWRGQGYTPDYFGIRAKLEALLAAGHADEVLALGEELIRVGSDQVGQSHDDGDTAMEVESCISVVVKALEQSSMETSDKLARAVDIVLDDQYDICEAFGEYLRQKHPITAWHALADLLLERLNGLKSGKVVDAAEDFSRRYARDRLGDRVIHALEQAGRAEEIIPLCESEARETDSYDRLVKRLMSARRHEDAERWIREGIRATGEKWPGIASGLRDKLREIRMHQKDWSTVAAMQAEEFVRRPSRQTYSDCKKAAVKVKAWTKVRQCLLAYLEKGTPPWQQKGWPLPVSGLEVSGLDASGLDTLKAKRDERFPWIDVLIDIAIYERKPDRVLHWYDQRPKDRFRWYGFDEDSIATAVQSHAPERAVAIWKNMAEALICQVKPCAYQMAAGYLRKAAKVMNQEKKQVEWERYLKELREIHIRKRRLIEILDGLDGKPIVKSRR